MIRWLYNLLFPIVFVALLPGYLRRLWRRGNYRQSFGQRFGWYSHSLRGRLVGRPRCIWLQAVSVGEMQVALKLVALLQSRVPHQPLVLSTTTTTGYQLAKQQAGGSVEIIYTPIDFAGAVRRAFRTLNPAQVVIVDGGLWPNQLWEAAHQKIPTFLVNARLSPRSERRFLRVGWLSARLFALLDVVCVPDQVDIARWEQLGVAPGRVHVTGSVKYDEILAQNGNDVPSHQSDQRSSRHDELKRILRFITPSSHAPVLLAGSTHPGEEKLVAGLFARLRTAVPDLALVVVPRHVERAPEIVADLESMGLKVARRTRLGPTDGLPSGLAGRVLLVDATGELRDWYRLATVAFIGKSFCAVGGQNPAEAISAGCPVLCGPHMENFAELSAQLIDAGGMVRAETPAELATAIGTLLADANARTRMVQAGQAQLIRHQGATERTIEHLLGAGNFAC